MNLRSQLAFVRRKWISSVYSRRVSLGNRGPIVSFTFDDFPRSALTIGGQILKNCGVRGTYYAAVGLMNKSNELGEQFRRHDLDALLRDGHELASHTFSHISCYSVSDVNFRKEVEEGRRAIKELTTRSDSGNFAFPFGEITAKAKKTIGSTVLSSRSIWGGLNGPEIDLSLLRANSLYGDRDKCAQVRELISDNERRRTWLIFYSHDVDDTPSRYGCTPELLEFAVLLASRGARILTVAEVVTNLIACPLDRASASVSAS